ncbi:universal stress protein A [Moraxella cuniculi DSM 21768]|uniref:Universal stress protein n=2 Tax=Moraxella cuniculi TaxID=34061 RepID=A0A1N7FDP4_9GAMM|nr:universal stress protein [Moraxella cuniculi]OOS07116.1 universal stress protein [Moraxella cuniculi]SIR98414.1 universal stress protein A [Moraxella cuniculi DSM 21768]VEG12324.1 Universal stress protein A homolog 2 [Moraxella cuniculi]
MYQHILLVTDLKDDTDLVAQKAKWILQTNPDAQLSVLHIVEETVVIGFGYELIPAAALNNQADDERHKLAKERLAAILTRNQLPTDHIKISTAISSSKGIVDYCQAHSVDLLVIGRHKRTGLSAWITGATADNVLPNIDSDLLVVQLTSD